MKGIRLEWKIKVNPFSTQGKPTQTKTNNSSPVHANQIRQTRDKRRKESETLLPTSTTASK